MRPRETRVVVAVRSRFLLAHHLSTAHPNGLLRLSARRTILPRPKHTEAELLGSTQSQAAKIAAGGGADPDENLRVVDQGTGQGSSMLCGCCQAACKLIFNLRNAAKVEDVMSSLTSGLSVRPTDAEQRHRDIFRY